MLIYVHDYNDSFKLGSKTEKLDTRSFVFKNFAHGDFFTLATLLII